MALTPIPSAGLWLPRYFFTSAFSTGALIDATGEKIAFIGPVWTPTRGTKSIRKVGFRFGSVTKAGGSALTVSLQDVDTTAGPPWRPDGTQDQTVAIANANATFLTNTWHQTGNLSADRSVAFGEMLAVVVEYDGGGRLGADSVIVSGLNPPFTPHMPGTVLFTASWALLGAIPNLVLEFSDGTFGGFIDSFSLVTTTNLSVTTATTPDEVALEFQVPWQCTVDAAFVSISTSLVSDFDIILYDSDGTTPLTNGTINVDANHIASASSGINPRLFSGLVTLQANTTYKLALKPTTTNAMAVYYTEVAVADYWGAMDGGGMTWRWTSRTDAGAWTPITTRRPWMGLRFVSFHPDSGSGGGAPRMQQVGSGIVPVY